LIDLSKSITLRLLFDHNVTFPEEMDGLIDFLFVCSLLLGIRHSKNIQKSGIKILVYILIILYIK